MKFSSPAGALLSVLALILLVPVSAPAADQKAVLVTGANSGIGRNIAERLAREGYFVYAGARRDADIEELSAIENMQGIRLDVTIQEDIDAAVETVRAEPTAHRIQGSHYDHQLNGWTELAPWIRRLQHE
jgi:NAD(P)-dependent dehydrogenase (short-subunit alcohol dehydrogenase family)